jgi:hypothetical protein
LNRFSHVLAPAIADEEEEEEEDDDDNETIVQT